MKQLLVFSVLAALQMLPIMPAVADESRVAEPLPERRRELIHLVRQDCGSCHGMQFKGGLGFPLTPDVLKERPFDGMVSTVYHGRPGTAMPPWKTIISEKEAEWIVQQLMTGFPRDEQ